MGLIQNVLNRFGYVDQKQLQARVIEAVKTEMDKDLPEWLGETADAYRWKMPPIDIFANQADLYRVSPILGTALDVLSNDVGTQKFNVKRIRGEDSTDIPNHPLELLLRNPNPIDSGLEFIRDTVSNYKLNGNAFWWLNKASDKATPDEIWTIPASMISPVPDKQMYISHFDYFPGNGQTLRLETWEIVHFKTYNPANRFIGLSPLESLVDTIVSDNGMRRTARTTYTDHGGMPPSILAFKDFPSNDVWADMKREAKQSAIRNEMMMLRGVGDGVSWMSRSINAKDSEFIASFKQNLTDVFNRMCPGLLAMLSENATEANALAASAFYAEKTLWVVDEALAQKITSDILPAYGLKLVGMFDDPRYVDRKLTLEEQRQYAMTHTVDQINKEYYQEVELGDERGNLFPVQINAQTGTEQPAPAGNPQAEPQPEPLDISQSDNMPADEMTPEDNTPAGKAALDDLLKFERKARKKIGKAVAFTSDILPVELVSSIMVQLETCTDESAVKAVFEQARAGLDEPTKSAIMMLADKLDKILEAAHE